MLDIQFVHDMQNILESETLGKSNTLVQNGTYLLIVLDCNLYLGLLQWLKGEGRA